MNSISEFHAFAHDLRRYLREAVTQSQLALRRHNDSLDLDVREAFERIADAGRACDALIQAMAVYEEADARPNQQWPLKRVVQAVTFDSRPMLDPFQSSLSVQVEPSQLNVLVPASVQKVWRELIANSVKFRRAEVRPEVSLNILAELDRLEFRVTDNGIGIAPKDREQVFLAFRRVHPRGAYPGFGLGLPFCRKILSQLGGDLRVEDSERGAVVAGWFRVP